MLALLRSVPFVLRAVSKHEDLREGLTGCGLCSEKTINGYSMNNGLWQGLWRRGKTVRRLCVTQGKGGPAGLGDSSGAGEERDI